VAPDLALVKQDLIRLEEEAAAFQGAASSVRGVEAGAAPPGDSGASLEQLLGADAEQARELRLAAGALRSVLVEQQGQLGREALDRLERRLTRLVRRARAGRIETVLGRKQALELEVEALSQGFLPRGAVDSLDAARYLADDEEYWPFDGEDWDDEYVGGEGLR